jgi:fructose-1,6-bisphosphatase I
MSDHDVIGAELSAYLARETGPDVARIINGIAEAARGVAAIIRRGPLEGALGETMNSANQDGDSQKALDLIADEAFIAALRHAGAFGLVSEENTGPLPLDPEGKLVVAIDPLDGSSNIDTNVSIGTIFSVYPAQGKDATQAATYLAPGIEQRAAGFVIYGPHTALVFTLGNGTHIATLDPAAGIFLLTRYNVLVKEGSSEFAINASNYRHWHRPMQAYIDDCIEGVDGPRGRNFNMRWIASLVADAYRIFMRGGVFLYPADKRKGYERGRLRHLYEANPIAFLIEQAGGMASDGVCRILDTVPTGIHDRIPLVFGSTDKVTRVRRYLVEESPDSEPSPLFGRRGLLRS